MIVVSDTSVLYYAAQLNCDSLLHQLYGTIIITPIIKRELYASQALFIQTLLNKPWLEVHIPDSLHLINKLREDLDAGESEAIALARRIWCRKESGSYTCHKTID